MKYCIFIFSLLIALGASAQYSTKSKKAIKLFELGKDAPRTSVDRSTGGPNFRLGIDYMNQAIEKDPNFWEAHMFAGEFCEYLRQYDEAINHYKRALEINPEHSRTGSTYFYLANLQFEVGDYDDAIKNLDIFIRNRNANPELVTQAHEIQASCDFAKEAIKNPSSFNPINICLLYTSDAADE